MNCMVCDDICERAMIYSGKQYPLLTLAFVEIVKIRKGRK